MTIADFKLKRYLNKYGSQYSEEAKQYILEHFNPKELEDTPDLLLQIYAALNVLPDNDNYYLGILELLKQYHNLGQDILEIGGGRFPAFAQYVDRYQRKIKKGTITVYDPDLVTTHLGHIELHKEPYQVQKSTKKYQLVIGILPCEATQLVVQASLKENAEFLLVLCNCYHLQGWHYIPPEIFHEQIEQWIMDTTTDDFEIYHGQLKLNYPFPYKIIGKRRK